MEIPLIISLIFGMDRRSKVTEISDQFGKPIGFPYPTWTGCVERKSPDESLMPLPSIGMWHWLFVLSQATLTTHSFYRQAKGALIQFYMFTEFQRDHVILFFLTFPNSFMAYTPIAL